MEKPKVFISHITEERELAKILKDEINKVFLGLPEIFVSSDRESISIGTKWLDEIDHALQGAQIMLLLCSENSIRRPWINFEAGAGWIKNIPVVPICHTNLKPINLPIPLNMLQGIEATDKEGLQKIFKLVGSRLGASFTPEVQYERVIEQINEFERDYGVIQVVKYHINEIIKLEPQFKQIFIPHPSHKGAVGYISELKLDKLRTNFDKLSEMGLASYGIGSNRITVGPGGGNEFEFTLKINDSYYDIADKIID